LRNCRGVKRDLIGARSQDGSNIVDRVEAATHGQRNKNLVSHAPDQINDDGTLNIEISPGSYIKIEKTAISMDWTAALNKPAATDKK